VLRLAKVESAFRSRAVDARGGAALAILQAAGC